MSFHSCDYFIIFYLFVYVLLRMIDVNLCRTSNCLLDIYTLRQSHARLRHSIHWIGYHFPKNDSLIVSHSYTVLFVLVFTCVRCHVLIGIKCFVGIRSHKATWHNPFADAQYIFNLLCPSVISSISWSCCVSFKFKLQFVATKSS